MEASRRRFEAIVEWAIAAAFIAAVVAVVAVAVREFRTVNPVTPVIAREPSDAPVPAGVPSRAVSVPMLPLQDGNTIRLGESLSSVTARLGREVEVRPPMADHTPVGERVTRFYNQAGTQFIVVFELPAGANEMQVSAIYLK